MKSVCKSFVYLSFSLATLAVVNSVRAQSITPDTTLGNENSVVNTNVDVGKGIPSDRIDGGATRGNNLFHSFSKFDIESGRGAYFANPAGIENIISRVTGSDVSNILGTLGVLGNANLFFANPNGIVFGPNARLDVSGSFFASTSDGFRFDNGFEFSASNPQAPPLLTINIPIGLRFRDNPGSITNQSIAQDVDGNSFGLQFLSGRTLALVGGDVNFEGGRVIAPGARVEIGGLSAEGIVGINDDLSLSFPEGVTRGNVSLINEALVNVLSENRGDIAVHARNFEILGGSNLIAGTFFGTNTSETQAGDIIIDATEEVKIEGEGNSPSRILNVVRTTDSTSSENTGDIGNGINANNTGTISLASPQPASTVEPQQAVTTTIELGLPPSSTYGGLPVELFPGEFLLIGIPPESLPPESLPPEPTPLPAPIPEETPPTPPPAEPMGLPPNTIVNGGNIKIEAGSLSMKDRSIISTATSRRGNAGTISVKVDDSITLANISEIRSNVDPGGDGLGGDINIEARSLTLKQGSQISTVVFREFNGQKAGIGKAGNIEIKTTDFVDISGISSAQPSVDNSLLGFSSGLLTSVERGSTATEAKAAGDITVTTGDFRIADGAVIEASTANSGNGGKITINARNFTANNGAQVITTTFENGNAGDIKLNIADRITIAGVDPNFAQRQELARNTGEDPDNVISNQGPESGIFANTVAGSQGNGGNISIDPKIVEILDGAKISADSQGEGEPGKIDIQVDELLILRRGSTISTNSDQDSNGGDININTDFLVSFPNENSDISANARKGKGGNIIINSTGIFGFISRSQQDLEKLGLQDFSQISTNDISATGATQELSGIVIINTPEIDPSDGLIELPETVVDAKKQIAQNACQQGMNSELVATGRGGLPPNPTQDLRSSAVRVGLATPVVSNTTNTTARKPKPTPTAKKIVPAQGWIFNSKGQIVLTAYNPNNIGVQRTAHKALCREK